MRLSILICLLIVVLCISFSYAKKKRDNTRKTQPKAAGKGNLNKGNFNDKGKWDDFDVKKKKSESKKKEKVVTETKKNKKSTYKADYSDDKEDDTRSGDGEENRNQDYTQLTSEEFKAVHNISGVGGLIEHCKPLFVHHKIPTVLNLYIFEVLLHTKSNLDTFPTRQDIHEYFTQGETRAQMQKKGVFYSVGAINKYFRSRDFRGIKEVDEMLKRHNESEFLVEQKIAQNPDKSMMPFYVVEGVNPATRKKVAQILAHRLKGLWIENQPRITLGPVLTSEQAKKAYYSFSKYMIANKIKLSLFNKPVVTESYWTEHASYIMAKIFEKADQLPNPDLEVYKFPEDLLVPNVTFVIFNTPPPRLGKGPTKSYLFEQRMLLIYKRFTGAKIYIIRFPESPRLIADKIDLYFHGERGFKTYTNKNYFNIEVLH